MSARGSCQGRSRCTKPSPLALLFRFHFFSRPPLAKARQVQELFHGGLRWRIGRFQRFSIATLRVRTALRGEGIEENRLCFHPPDAQSKGSEPTPPPHDP